MINTTICPHIYFNSSLKNSEVLPLLTGTDLSGRNEHGIEQNGFADRECCKTYILG
jgi:hypothetical protein